MASSIKERPQLSLFFLLLASLLSIPHPHVNKKTVASLHGSLQHVTLVYQQGQLCLSALSRFLSKFPNDHVLHHLPTSWLHQLSWWSMALVIPNPSCILIKLPLVDLDIWVDALTSWDIGLWVGGLWAAWYLVSGWSDDGQGIGQAEATAVKLAVAWLTQSGWHDACLKIHCDNNSVLSSFWKGHSRCPAHNQTLCRMTAHLASENLSISPTYIPSTSNRADPLFQGILGTSSSCIAPKIIVPEELCVL